MEKIRHESFIDPARTWINSDLLSFWIPVGCTPGVGKGSLHVPFMQTMGEYKGPRWAQISHVPFTSLFIICVHCNWATFVGERLPLLLPFTSNYPSGSLPNSIQFNSICPLTLIPRERQLAWWIGDRCRYEIYYIGKVSGTELGALSNIRQGIFFFSWTDWEFTRSNVWSIAIKIFTSVVWFTDSWHLDFKSKVRY